MVFDEFWLEEASCPHEEHYGDSVATRFRDNWSPK